MVTAARIKKFKRVTDLFEQGRVVVLDPNPEDPLLVWVAKLNPFEMDEARKDGTVGRARALLRLDEDDAPEAEVLKQVMAEQTREKLIDGLLQAKHNEDYSRATDEMRTLEEWKDKLAVLDRADEQMLDAGLPEDDDEHARLAELNRQYIEKLQELVDEFQAERKNELDVKTDDELKKAFLDSYKERVGSNGFLNEYRVTEMYYAMRTCDAKPDGEGWDHSGCNHKERLLETRQAVRELPEEVIALIREGLLLVSMSPRDAGNSDAPASSSASSEQPSAEAAASTPSTPTET